jgi:three-Cys-motif partner protein
MTGEGKEHRFGGPWTAKKLKVLKKYLSAYTQALKKQPFQKYYIDAFAGTGYRSDASDHTREGCLPFEEGSPDLLDGSARIALKVSPSFDTYIFIEKNAKRCAELEKLKQEFPGRTNDIQIIQGDANQTIQILCRENWAGRRAVLFVDPYGMQVDWVTIQAIAKTKAIDLWVLFPLGMGINRLLSKDGKIEDNRRERLNTFLGTEDWYKELYSTTKRQDLYGNEVEEVEKATIDVIGRYCVNRLKQVFMGVAEKPAVLKNKTNNQMYLFCFAVSNEKGKDLALRIANNILENLS